MKFWKKLQKATKGVCIVSWWYSTGYVHKQRKKYLGVFTGQAYTVVYATVKYLLNHPYIWKRVKASKKHYNK